MIRHIVIWDMKQTLTDEQRKDAKKKIKVGLEALLGVIHGMNAIHVEIEPLESSNGDLMLDSTFESVQALNDYQVHPEHKKIGVLVKESTTNRRCIDYTDMDI